MKSDALFAAPQEVSFAPIFSTRLYFKAQESQVQIVVVFSL